MFSMTVSDFSYLFYYSKVKKPIGRFNVPTNKAVFSALAYLLLEGLEKSLKMSLSTLKKTCNFLG